MFTSQRTLISRFSSVSLLRHFSLRTDVAAHMIPHPEKAHKGGEDAYFISENKQAFGLADGVGGWANSGVDPAIYAREIMSHALKEADEDSDLLPEEIMSLAYDQTKSTGSSTVCIATVLKRVKIPLLI